ncbi:hypothetical protein OPV22_015841 [Ensete ventricosum]|uniref:Uncharacterized protein n=1 Tax=Ensete ventricosum TaxID=4639 RepID=A0AAV8RAT1_ENSVE|nr:hypothetical protein OPV22_015841 [Ensete ventricosum]
MERGESETFTISVHGAQRTAIGLKPRFWRPFLQQAKAMEGTVLIMPNLKSTWPNPFPPRLQFPYSQRRFQPANPFSCLPEP